MSKNTINLLKNIKQIVQKARYNSFYSVNREMLNAYFEIGRIIVEEEQKGEKRAKYGQKLLEMLSQELTKEFKKGFCVKNLERMRKFYQIYRIRASVMPELNNSNRIPTSVMSELNNHDQICASLTRELNNQLQNPTIYSWKLTWTHYCELIKIKDKTKRDYFEKYAVQENLSVRDLKRQIYSFHYERLLMSKDKKALIKHETKNLIPTTAEEAIKDPYILEFLNLDERHTYTEKEIETKILDNLQKFILELGQGFSFVKRQKRFTIDNDHFYIDLLFYNIYLKCYIIIELKIGKFTHRDTGQMNFYLNYVKDQLNKKDDNEPIGIILCTEKNNISVKYALSGISNKLFISKYKLFIPSKEELEKEVKKLI